MQNYTTQILDPQTLDFAEWGQKIRSGSIGGIPTETVYGLAGNAFDEDALAQIFSAKERPTFDPLIVHVAAPREDQKINFDDLDQMGLIDPVRMSQLAREDSQKLIHTFWPGPLTLVLPKSTCVPDLATSGLGTVGIRAPFHPIAQKLLRAAQVPLAAPSANRFGKVSPTSANDVLKELGGRIPWIVDGGPCSIGIESTVLAWIDDHWVMLRPGAITFEDLRVHLLDRLHNQSGQVVRGAAQAPGMLESHYAPKKSLYLLEAKLSEITSFSPAVQAALKGTEVIGYLGFSGERQDHCDRLESLSGKKVICKILSQQGDEAEAARNLFSSLRTLDESSAQVLLCEPTPQPDQGISHAIMDRLKRASIK